MAAAKNPCKYGIEQLLMAQTVLKDFDKHSSTIYTWIDEYFADAERTLAA